MFDRWLYSPRNYIMTFLGIALIYSLALEELTYSVMGQAATGKITDIEKEQTDYGPAGSKKVLIWNHYTLTDPQLDEPLTGRFQGDGHKVGDPVEIQHIPGWAKWYRPASENKAWLGWGVLIFSIVATTVAIVLGREASDPFAKARAQRHRT